MVVCLSMCGFTGYEVEKWSNEVALHLAKVGVCERQYNTSRTSVNSVGQKMRG